MKLLELNALNTLIASIAKRGAKLDQDIQLAGLSAIAHHAKCGDIGPINRLYNALSKGTRRAAMTSWLLAYSGTVANTDKETKADKPFVHQKDKAADVEGAEQDPWFEHKPDQDPDKVFDVRAALAAVLKKAAKATNVEHRELIGAVSAILDAAPAEAAEATATEPAEEGPDGEND